MTKFSLSTAIAMSLLVNINSTSAANLDCNPLQGDYAQNFSTSNVTFRGADSDACAGIFEGNDVGAKGNGEENLASAFGGTWDLLLNSDSQLNASLTDFAVNFTLSEFPAEQTSGSWILSWIGSDLPIEVDFAAVIKTNNSWAAYLFEDEVFQVSPNSGSGTWESAFANPNDSLQSLSHFSLYVRDISQPPAVPTSAIPAPATLALLSIGLLGLALRKSRKS